jgi:hypothetical protein
MSDIFKPRFLQYAFAPRILIGVGGDGSTAVDTVARDAAEAAQQSVDAITAQVGEVISPDQGVISSDGKQFLNASGQGITLTGTSAVDLVSDGLTEVSAGGLGPQSVTATELADAAVSNQKMADMAALSLKGNDDSSPGVPRDVSMTTVASMMPVASGSSAGFMSAADKQKSDLADFNFNNVAQMVASADLTVGTLVNVGGYFGKGDGGGNRFEIVASGTGVHDGGSFIDLSGSGLQARGLFSQGYFFEQWGTVKDGTSDDAPAIRAALTWCAAEGVGTISAFDGKGVFGVSGLIQLPENVVLDFGYGTMAPLSNDAGINLRRNSGLENLSWDATGNASWVGPMLLADSYTDSNIANYPRLKNVSCMGFRSDPNSVVYGTMIKLDASSGLRITGIRAKGLLARDLATVAEFIPCAGASSGYINSNALEFDMIVNCRRGIVMDRLSSDQSIENNYIQASYQTGATEQLPFLSCNGRRNEFDLLVWDWSRSTSPVVVDFAADSKENAVVGALQSLAVKDASDSGFRNSITSRSVSEVTFASKGMEPASSNSGLFGGQVDNCLAYANKRYAVTAPAVSSGSLNDAFTPNSVGRPVWNSATSLAIEIDLLSNKSNLRSIGVAFSNGSIPDFVRFERSTDGTSWTEVEYVPGSRVTAWLGSSFTGSTFRYLRITITSDSPMDYKVAQIFAWWKGEAQGAYLPTGGGDLYGNVELMAGASTVFESSNGNGSASINSDNSNRLQISAVGGVKLNGVRILGDQQPAVTDPAGGSVVDTECRAALIALADRIRNHGLIGL